MIIALLGALCSGKAAVAFYLQKEFGFVIVNLFEVFGAQHRLGTGPYSEIDTETAREVLGEVERLATGPLAAAFAEAARRESCSPWTSVNERGAAAVMSGCLEASPSTMRVSSRASV